MTEQLAREVFHTAGESIEVLSPPVDAAIAQAHAIRRRQRRVATRCAVVVVVAIAALTWATTRPADEEPPEPGIPDVVPSPNPAEIAWYAGGQLHLDAVAVELPQLTDLVEIDEGAVYGDRSGNVAHVAADGTRTMIGQKVAGTPLVGSDQAGWVAWVDARGDVPQLVVYDVVAGRLLDQLSLPPGDSRPIAIDQGDVVYATPDGDFTWTPLGSEPERLDRSGLLDSASATRVYQEDRHIETVQLVFNVHFVRRGEGASLSAGGNYVLTRAPSDWRAGAPFRPLLYDARDGDQLASGVGPDELALDASFGAEHDLVYVVGRIADLAAGADLDGVDAPLLTLRSCELGTGDCHDVVLLPRAGEQPLLAD